ncbi:membrane-bound PQQ-dependent dehydrogenase, glucose/quinate/shikimate family [Bradyrhizobium genosp. P]|uniref:membrane-bound PQQ-dependent dehydrogenase, glucose/quinate/shikimate family n=1 Tax=Bradyrhizobium genosp. P TaxID=83641 RepID=UPI003CEB6C42
MRFLSRALGGLIGLIGLALSCGGAWLVTLGGSLYYLLAGAAYLFAGIQLWRLRPQGAWLVAGVALVTLAWAIWECGINYWALFPRLLMPLGLAAAALLLTAPLLAKEKRLAMSAAGTLALLFAVGQVALAFTVHGTIQAVPGAPFNHAKVDNAPSDWTAYGRTTAGTRYAPFDQINRSNVAQLEVAWQFHHGDTGPGVDQNIPLLIGDTLYTCSPNDIVAAVDADTGALRWRHDPHATGPTWQRCRGLGYYAMPATAGASASGICAQRIINGTTDARLIALDAKTGELCPDFGDHGQVDLKQGMGTVDPGFAFETSAPLVARNNIVVGGYVLDNQKVGEPSGVVRAFDARTGVLVWAWDLGNPAITREPPPGQTYTRGTPNMWTTAAYDDRLGLVYLPLGNETPDYFGGSRMKTSDDYNSSIVAVDVLTGRERWKVQTVHHDIWDYDLPSQPALVDLPDNKGGTVPALMQTTKRGQIFLVNRETGAALAEIAEKPVTQKDAAPGERLSPTQPYSVGMPTIGAERLSEKKMWGATMLDQLYCRISFLQHNYDGDFSPPGLKPTIQQPGNGGGMNWGSVSYDPANHLAFINDIRVPSEFWLIPRDEYVAWAKAHPSPHDGHGPAAMAGLPYGEATYFWMSPIGVPCTEPPFGTITAIDLDTHKIAWQVPAGTAEKLGPFGIASHMPMPIGMPTYAGTMTTAGGLVFFAGFQDYYIRAYDAQTGKEVWKYTLPVGSSATPMSYVSPKTGRQYIVLSVGGASHSNDTADLVIAFALPAKAAH